MSTLTDALDVFELQRGDKMYPGERLIVDAARRMAVYEAYYLTSGVGSPVGIDLLEGECDGYPTCSNCANLEHISVVNAALTPTRRHRPPPGDTP